MQPIKFNGQIITEPGIYSDIDIDLYHNNPYLLNGPSISSSTLKMFIDRPSLYWANCAYNKDRQEREDKDHYTFGQAAHHLILGEANFQKYFALRPERYDDDGVIPIADRHAIDPSVGKKWSGNSTVCKNWVLEQRAAGKQILKIDDVYAIEQMAKRLQAMPEVQNGILSGQIETSMFVKHGGTWLRSRPDVIPEFSTDYADTKFVQSINYFDLQRAIFNFGWDIQAAICRKAHRELHDDEGFAYFLVFQEKTAPYDVYTHEVGSATLDNAIEVVDTALDYFNYCLDKWEWPGRDGFDQGVNRIDIPPFGITQRQESVSHMRSQITQYTN